MNMDNKKYDDLDKLFQSRLKKDQIVEEDWNKAPKSAFEGAMSIIDKQKRKKRRILFLWILFAGLLIGFTYITINNFNKINHLENTIASMESDNEALNAYQDNTKESSIKKLLPTNSTGNAEQNVESIMHDFPDKMQIKSQGNIVSANAINRKVKGFDTNKRNVDQNRQVENQKQNIAPNSLIGEQINDVNNSNSFIDQVAEIMIPEGIGEKHNSIPTIPLLSILKHKLVNKKEYLIPMEAKQLPGLVEEHCEPFPWKLYALGGVNASTIKMTNTEGADFTLTGYERYYSDAFTGFGLEYNFNPRWSVDLQVNYNKLHVKSSFEDEISYDSSLEVIDNQGNAKYESGYDVFTVMGRQSGEMSFALKDINIADKDEFMNQTLIDNSFETFGISLASNYKLYCNEKWSFDAGIGIQYNQLLNLNEKIETSIYYKQGLMLKESVETQAQDYANSNYLSLFGNMRLAYKISEHYGIRLDVGSAHSLNSIRKIYDTNDSKTYINNLKASLQVYYSF